MANEALKNSSKANDFQTPIVAVEPLLKYINSNWIIWECASGKGNISNHLESKGIRVISSDILTGQDFLVWHPETHYDCIITNPPYSLKDEFLKRCYLLERPFALLLPLTTLEEKRQRWLEKYGIEIILLDRRINFETPSGKGSGVWLATAWFTNGLEIGKQLTFEQIK